MLMYSSGFSTNMLVAKLAQMGNICLDKSDAMWPMAQMATGSVSLDYVNSDGRTSKTGTEGDTLHFSGEENPPDLALDFM